MGGAAAGLGHPASVFPQCEQFVEQHVPQLLALAPQGWDAHTACQVPAPAAGPGLLKAPRAPLSWIRSPGVTPG